MSQSESKTKNLLMGIGIIAGFFIILAIAVGVKWMNNDPRLANKVDASVLKIFPHPIAIPSASLIDKQGKPFDFNQLKNRWTFLYFGYTLCPDICPTELTALAGVLEQLREQKVKAAHGVLFVSVDQQRDTPDRLHQFVDYFDASIQAVSGEESELRIMAQPIGAAWDKVAQFDEHGQPDQNNYLINHTTSILLVDPQGRAVGVFPTPHDPEAMAKAFTTVVPE
jgi:protein SCO1/2